MLDCHWHDYVTHLILSELIYIIYIFEHKKIWWNSDYKMCSYWLNTMIKISNNLFPGTVLQFLWFIMNHLFLSACILICQQIKCQTISICYVLYEPFVFIYLYFGLLADQIPNNFNLLCSLWTICFYISVFWSASRSNTK